MTSSLLLWCPLINLSSARLVLVLQLGDGFYLENVSGRADGVKINGAPLEPERIEPIQPDDVIEAGSVRIEVGEFEQLRPMA